MTWAIEFEQSAAREFRRLDRKVQRRIRNFLQERAESNPRSSGGPLRGQLAEFWRYRIGDYRIICDLRDSELLVLILRVAHRSKV